jgi:hypothetical protein
LLKSISHRTQINVSERKPSKEARWKVLNAGGESRLANQANRKARELPSSTANKAPATFQLPTLPHPPPESNHPMPAPRNPPPTPPPVEADSPPANPPLPVRLRDHFRATPLRPKIKKFNPTIPEQIPTPPTSGAQIGSHYPLPITPFGSGQLVAGVNQA